VLSTEEARGLATVYAPEVDGKSAQQLAAYRRMPDSVLFRVQKVRVKLDECDLPGPTRRKVVCSRCGQIVRDRREVVADGRILCKPCSAECYFSHPHEVTWSDMNWAPQPTGAPAVEPAGQRACKLVPIH
jgi:formylmethanofuran dehydrogenase subunit E